MQTVTATRSLFEEVLAGKRVGFEGEVVCAWCKDSIEENDRVAVRAYRLTDEDVWSIPRVYCVDCGDRPFFPTLGAEEIVAEAILATLSDPRKQDHEAALVEPVIEQFSPPTEGSEP